MTIGRESHPCENNLGSQLDLDKESQRVLSKGSVDNLHLQSLGSVLLFI